MYVWTGIDVDNQLEDIKRNVFRIERAIGFQHSNFTLPFHISLKISFEIEEADLTGVVTALSDLYAATVPFEILICGLERYDNIIWIRMENNQRLNLLHDSVNSLMKSQFGVGLHEYDLDYMFHTTLFMDGDSEKIRAAYDQIQGQGLPKRLFANTFVIGASRSGTLGSYTVLKEIKCNI